MSCEEDLMAKGGRGISIALAILAIVLVILCVVSDH